MPFLDADDISNERLLMLIYGASGVGKTWLCGSALDVEEMLPILWCEVDGGLVTVRDKLLPAMQEKNVRVLSMADQGDIDIMRKILLMPSPSAKTVILDSLPEYYDLKMRLHLAAMGRGGLSPQLQDYGVLMRDILGLLREVREQGKTNFIVTCGDSVSKDEMDGSMHWDIDMPGKLQAQVHRYFHIVGYLNSEIKAKGDGQIRSVVRTLQVQPFGRIKAKSRTPDSKLGPVVTDPDFRKIYDDFRGTYVPEELEEE